MINKKIMNECKKLKGVCFVNFDKGIFSFYLIVIFKDSELGNNYFNEIENILVNNCDGDILELEIKRSFDSEYNKEGMVMRYDIRGNYEV